MPVSLSCTCGHVGHLSSDKLHLDESEFNLQYVATNLHKFRCSKCGSAPEFVFNDRNDLIFDMGNLVNCSSCEFPIPEGRLKALPGTSVCTECARAGAMDMRAPPPHPQPPKDIATCPRCGNRTEMRQNNSDKSWFVGCSSYPSCRFTKNL